MLALDHARVFLAGSFTGADRHRRQAHEDRREVIAAHGGLDRWQAVRSLDVIDGARAWSAGSAVVVGGSQTGSDEASKVGQTTPIASSRASNTAATSGAAAPSSASKRSSRTLITQH
jgi:hypothetical protein